MGIRGERIARVRNGHLKENGSQEWKYKRNRSPLYCNGLLTPILYTRHKATKFQILFTSVLVTNQFHIPVISISESETLVNIVSGAEWSSSGWSVVEKEPDVNFGLSPSCLLAALTHGDQDGVWRTGRVFGVGKGNSDESWISQVLFTTNNNNTDREVIKSHSATWGWIKKRMGEEIWSTANRKKEFYFDENYAMRSRFIFMVVFCDDVSGECVKELRRRDGMKWREYIIFAFVTDWNMHWMDFKPIYDCKERGFMWIPHEEVRR